MKLLVSRITLADGKAACPNCEHELLPERDVTKWVNTLGSDQPRMAFAKCLYCGTVIEIRFTEEQE